jgi:SprT-like family
MIIKARYKFPKCLRKFKEVKGIYVEECIDLNNTNPFILSRGRIPLAHAHPRYFDPFRGWICLKEKEMLEDEGTLLHEVAHLIACKLPWIQPHGKEFKKVCREIGAPIK